MPPPKPIQKTGVILSIGFFTSKLYYSIGGSLSISQTLALYAARNAFLLVGNINSLKNTKAA